MLTGNAFSLVFNLISQADKSIGTNSSQFDLWRFCPTTTRGHRSLWLKIVRGRRSSSFPFCSLTSVMMSLSCDLSVNRRSPPSDTRGQRRGLARGSAPRHRGERLCASLTVVVVVSRQPAGTVASSRQSLCVSLGLLRVASTRRAQPLRFLAAFSFGDSLRTSMSHTCRRAKGSCTRGRPRPTKEEGPPWCCAATTPLFMRGRRSARAPCCSCSGCLGSTASTMCLHSPWTFTSLAAFSYQV